MVTISNDDLRQLLLLAKNIDSGKYLDDLAMYNRVRVAKLTYK